MHLQIALMCATDWYIFSTYEGVIFIILACVINFLVLLGWSNSYRSRNEPSSEAIAGDRPEDVQGGNADKQAFEREKTGA